MPVEQSAQGTLRILKNSEIKRNSVKIIVSGLHGIGKTSLVKTCPTDDTLFLNLEGGDLSVQHWTGQAIKIGKWESLREIVQIISGGDPNAPEGSFYTVRNAEAIRANYTNSADLRRFPMLFIDSLTQASRFCYEYCQGLPGMKTRNGQIDGRAVYGQKAKEFVAWNIQLSRCKVHMVATVGMSIQEETTVDNKLIKIPKLQIEGQKSGSELPAIWDVLCTMAAHPPQFERLLYCHAFNPFDYPNKDRSGKLDATEPPNISLLINKIFAERISQTAVKTPVETATPIANSSETPKKEVK